MLKGILFIIAIIVTFDIGKTLIDSYREEQSHEATQTSQDKSVENDNKLNTDESKDVRDAEGKSQINLNLPEGSDRDESEDSSDDTKASFSTNSSKEQSLNLKAKPIMSFDLETRTPDINGVSVEVKKTY